MVEVKAIVLIPSWLRMMGGILSQPTLIPLGERKIMISGF